ncbi:MAG: SHOCT domain-containing protein [Lactobacillus sp.]|nr:SHOCT domain-containing protein [Lactobacillus sp.]
MVSALIGTAAGLSSGGKTTSQNSGGEKQTIISTRQVEITSYAYISLYNINTKQFGQIVILAKTADFAVLKKFKIHHIENKHVVNNKPISQENLQLLQQLAQLRNQGIISPEEFEMKKQQLL